MAKCLVAGCAKHAMKGSLKCFQHDPSPEAEAKRKELSARMVAARAAKRAARLNPQQPTENMPDNPALRTSCKRHGWVGGWFEDCPLCKGQATTVSNPDAIPNTQWVEVQQSL